MGSFLNAIYAIWNQIVYAVSNIRIPFDIIDILVIAFVLYKSIVYFRDTRAGKLVKGLLILFAVYFIAEWWDLATMSWILSRVVDSVIIVAAIIFQPELRRFLEKVGNANFKKGQLFVNETDVLGECIDNVSKAAAVMQEKKIGALIVFENKTQLGEIINTGTVIDAESSVSIINNVFFPKSPLHDGAMIIRGGRVYAAGCILPLTQRQDLSLNLGTRHRAAIGMTENSDAIVLVVSEETGIISLVVNGHITRNYNPASAGAELKRLLIDTEQNDKSSTISTFFKKFIPKAKENEGKEGK